MEAVSHRVLSDADNYLPSILSYLSRRDRAAPDVVSKEWLLASSRLCLAVSSDPTRAFRTFSTLREAIAAAGAGDVIDLDPGEYEGPFEVRVPSLSISCPRGRARVFTTGPEPPLRIHTSCRLVNLDIESADADAWQPREGADIRPPQHSSVHVCGHGGVFLEGCTVSRPNGSGIAAEGFPLASLGCAVLASAPPPS